ncbi:autotransporter domain-containing protein [Pseudomonas protegens]|uniref:autotransporter domain-containing protein n=1 Tax=Pseudomonas protegens TaxID=380021 RepID=UPI0021C811E7|nr:autotransporter domain-containing protein [Pseudomonas protegens]MCU1765531.1 autotransporter domain-containing protein [Pseudomonas protegens]
MNSLKFSVNALMLGVLGVYSVESEAMLDIIGVDESYSMVENVSANGTTVVGYSSQRGVRNNAFKYSDESGKVSLGSLGGAYSYAADVSGDGAVIVGRATNSLNSYRAFKYTDGTGMVSLGTLGGTDVSAAYAVSTDGTTVVGASFSSVSQLGQAFKHTDSTGMIGLGTLGGSSSAAYGVSADGAVIIGSSWLSGDINSHAFKYTDSSGMIDLGGLGGSISVANALSADGKVIAGYSTLANGDAHVFKHTDNSGMVDLGTLGGQNSGMYSRGGISADGSVIVGFSELAGGGSRAFKHTDATGMRDLGTLGGHNSFAYAVSADGLVIVGGAEIASGTSHAFKYTDNLGMIDLGTLGGDTSRAIAVSADGAVIIGQSETATGQTHAFIVKDVRMVDLDNSYVAMEQNGHQLNSILNLQATLLSSALDHDCRVFGENNVCVAVGSEYSRVNNKSSSLTGLGLTLGYLLTPEVRVGLFMDQSLDSNLPDNYRIKSSMPMFGGFAAWNSRPDGLGAEIKGSVAYSKLDTEITRLTLDNTEAGKGRSKVKGLGLQLETSYGLALGERWKVQPFIGLKRVDSQRDGYREHKGADFAMSYRAVENNASSLYVGSGLRAVVTKDLVLSTRFGVEQDISRSTSDYRSRAEYLGGMKVKASAPQRVRGFASLGAEYNLGNARYISINGNVAQQSLGQELGYGLMASYTFGF